MMPRRNHLNQGRLAVGLLAGWFALSAMLAAQQITPQPVPVPAPATAPVETTPQPEPSPEEKSLTAIRSLRASIEAVEAEIAQLKNDSRAVTTPAEQAQAAAKLDAKIALRDALRQDIESVATGVDLDNYAGSSAEAADLAVELEEFLRPIIGELKDLTAKPREIEALRNSVARHQRQIDLARKAIANLDDLIAANHDASIATDLGAIRKDWAGKLAAAENDLGVARFKLEDAEKNRSSLLRSATDAAAAFFRTRGRNFLTAILSFVAVWFLLRLLYRQAVKYSPFHRRKERGLSLRLVEVVYQVFSLAAATFTVLLVLYAASDWVLLGLVLLFMAGLAWASKQALPIFFEQAKMLLNLGPVREDERIVFDGVPWKVKRINVYTDLENPALTGGKMRLPIRALLPLHSRPFETKEPWFPTAEGDWVILGDGTFGRVIQQTPEWVQVIQLGGARKTYATPDFLSLRPQNLSANFRISIVFGIDYQHQAIATTIPPALFRERLMQRLTEWVTQDEIINIAVEFKEAGSSSLDYAILADFAGSTAPKYQKLSRAIPRICVEVCNEKGWVIPFTQVTVHQAVSG